MRSLELFAGCGGLAMGLAWAGFHHELLVERDADAVATLRFNRDRGIAHVRDWPIEDRDVRSMDWRPYRGRLDLISGGPPCQPFGIGGKKRGPEDGRDMWPEAVRAIREARPRSFLFENVRNLASPTFRPYLNWVVACLRHPDLPRREGESHLAHLERLETAQAAPAYEVVWQVANAADHGAPQSRHRVIVQGIATDLGVRPEPLTPSHGQDRLLWDQYVTGEYWSRHGLPPAAMRGPHAARVATLEAAGKPPALKPWTTLRDAIADLGEPNGKSGHTHRAGARAYAGHTGSPLDLPAKALKAGDHGVPGGENMIRFEDGAVRYLTAREAARLAGLPDDYEFPRSWSETMRQLGNAVPAALGKAAGAHLRRRLETARA